jgi:hypothetical protein
MASYDQASPYYTTGYTQFFLETMTNRPIPKEPDDQYFTISLPLSSIVPTCWPLTCTTMPTLWWVFYQRNPNTLSAPPLDFKSGTQIYLPKITTLQSALGI